MKERRLCVRFLCNVRKGGRTVQSEVAKSVYIPLTKDPPRNKKRLKKFIQNRWMNQSFGKSSGSPKTPTTIEVLKIISQKKTKKGGGKCKKLNMH